MKLDVLEDKYILFTYDISSLGDLSCIKEENIAMFLKDVFVSLSDIYSIDLFGYYKVDIYIDKNIGSFIEISKIDEYLSYGKKIDTKVSININSFYLKTKDLSKIIIYDDIYQYDNYYFISTESVDNILDVVEYCEIVYKEYDDFFKNRVKL